MASRDRKQNPRRSSLGPATNRICSDRVFQVHIRELPDEQTGEIPVEFTKATFHAFWSEDVPLFPVRIS